MPTTSRTIRATGLATVMTVLASLVAPAPASARLFKTDTIAQSWDLDKKCTDDTKTMGLDESVVNGSPDAKKRFVDFAFSTLKECQQAHKLNPDNAWIEHDFAFSYLVLSARARDGSLADFHAAGIRSMVHALNVAKAGNDAFTISSGCGDLHHFRNTNDPDCDPQFAANAAASVQAQIAAMNRRAAEEDQRNAEL